MNRPPDQHGPMLPEEPKTFDTSICKLRHPDGSEAGTCPCLAPKDCPQGQRCDNCGGLIDGRPWRVRCADDHNETEEVCFSCYQKVK